jgi:adenosine kinase
MMGSIKIAHRGGQNHSLTRTELAEAFHAHFGYRIEL